MAGKVLRAIRSEADFRKAVDVISLDLGRALDSFTLFHNLIKAKEGPYTKAVSQSQTFWGLTYRALLDSTVARLCRVYDSHAGALTLPNLLATIRLRPAFLPSASEPIDFQQLCRDEEAVGNLLPFRSGLCRRLAGDVRTAGPPRIELGFERVDGTERVVDMPVNRQAFFFLPTHGRAHAASQVRGNLLPRLQSVGPRDIWFGLTCGIGHELGGVQEAAKVGHERRGCF